MSWNHGTPIGEGSRSGVNLHHPQTTMAGDTSDPGTTSVAGHIFFELTGVARSFALSATLSEVKW